MRLPLDAIKGDPQRSYLNLGDRLRVWARGREDLGEQLREVWRRMAFNALVGNVDDHALNHGLLHDGHKQRGWRLSPAFDITPLMAAAPQPLDGGPVLSMATGADGSARAGKQRLLAATGHFGFDADTADAWLRATAQLVAERWEPMLRAAAGPIMEDASRMDALIADARAAFAYSERLATHL